MLNESPLPVVYFFFHPRDAGCLLNVSPLFKNISHERLFVAYKFLVFFTFLNSKLPSALKTLKI